MQSYEFLKAWRERVRFWESRVPARVIDLPTEELEKALQAGRPLVTLLAPELPAGLFAEVVTELCGLLARYRNEAEVRHLCTVLSGAGDADRLELVRGVRGEVSLTEWAARHGVDGGLLTTLASLAIQPFMNRYARLMAEAAPLQLWRQNFCPACGSDADVCRIDPDNLRFLHCPTCDTQWEHHRLTCTTCGTDDIKQVRLLTVESLEPWRVEVCDACGGYVKTLDQRHGGLLAMPKLDLFLEDARTLQLDMLAEQEGYRRGGRAQ